MCTSRVGTVKGELVSPPALVNRGAVHTITSGIYNVSFMDNPYSRCVGQQSTHSLQALGVQSMVTSLLGNSRLVALCSLAISQGGH